LNFSFWKIKYSRILKNIFHFPSQKHFLQKCYFLIKLTFQKNNIILCWSYEGTTIFCLEYHNQCLDEEWKNVIYPKLFNIAYYETFERILIVQHIFEFVLGALIISLEDNLSIFQSNPSPPPTQMNLHVIPNSCFQNSSYRTSIFFQVWLVAKVATQFMYGVA
jgi:hypothetical protein